MVEGRCLMVVGGAFSPRVTPGYVRRDTLRGRKKVSNSEFVMITLKNHN
jgi:hypothetical protein